VLKEVPAVGERYFLPAEAIFRSAPADPTADFPTQMAKICTGLISDRYAVPDAENAAVAGAGHSSISQLNLIRFGYFTKRLTPPSEFHKTLS